MTKREKILAAAVVLMVLAVAFIFVTQSLQSEFVRRENRRTQLTEEVNNQDRIINQGKLAAKRLGQYSERSLPSNPTLARSLYQDWLLEMAVRTGFSGVNVSPLPSRPVGDIYFQHSFLVSGRGDLPKLIEFLHGFHDKGYLHRVKTLAVKPVTRSRSLDLSVTVEALSMNRAQDRDELHDPPAARSLPHELSEYVATIVDRNMFGPANNPPEISFLGTQTGHPGQSLRFRVQAKDVDELDELSYFLNGTPLEGARIHEDSGEVEWMPPALGEYEISVGVSDDGLPARVDTETVKIAIVEPPPPAEAPPERMEFDAAKHSVVTGITDAAGRREIWVSIRTEGRLLKLAEGDEVSVGSVQGVVNRIGAKMAEIKTHEGQVIIVGLGKSLLPDETAPLGGL